MTHLKSILRCLFVAAVLSLGLPAPAPAANPLVGNRRQSGPGSLRADVVRPGPVVIEANDVEIDPQVPRELETDANADDTEPPIEPAGDLPGCRQAWRTGRYREAQLGYEKLLDQEPLRLAASIGLADALAAQGEYARAVDALRAATEPGAADARWQLALAEHLQNVGQYDQALTHARQARRLRPAWAPAIRTHGRLLETLGRTDQAIETYAAMAEVIEQGEYTDDAESLVALGQILDRHGVLTGRKASEQAANILHNYFQQAYQEVDKGYWPARIVAGGFLLDKGRTKAALAEFAAAIRINQRLPDAYVGAGLVQLGMWQWEKVFATADKALKINPNHPDAHMLKAMVYLQRRKFEKAPEHLDKVLAINPNHLQALSLMAAAYIRMDQPDQAEAYSRRVAEINPTYPGLPSTIAEWLSAGRQFAAAEKHYLEAIDRAPYLAEGHAGLGKLYMQTGEEDKARQALRRAHELDDFRVDVVNYLKLLEEMEDFLVKETEHFIVKVDARRDAVLLDQVAEYMESIHDDVCADFGHEPPDKTVIEIMPTHETFSVRITGRGWIGTVGACTGRVIALAAPTPEKSRSPFGTHNWATVLRHEYTHTITLSATDNRIPHWFTEACAVWQQPDRRNYQATQALVAAVRTGRLFKLDDLDWGFIRPKRNGDRSLAYAQSEWILEFLITHKGFGVVAEMLAGFRDGLSQQEVFDRIVGIPADRFDEQFQTWAAEQVVEWGFADEQPVELEDAARLAKEHPEDADAQADYALALYANGRTRGRSEAQARKALELDPAHRRALAVLASMLTARKQYDEAIDVARRLDQADPTSTIAPRLLAQCHLAQRSWLEAVGALELLKQRQPLDPFPYDKLAQIYTQFGKPDRALPNLVELHRRTMKDPKYARQVAEIYRSMGRHDLALDYFRQIAHINPYEASAYQAMAAIHLRQDRFDQAIDAVENVCLLEPASAQSWDYMAMVQYRAGRAQQDRQRLESARQAARKSMELEPNGQGSQILRLIESAMQTLGPAPAAVQ